MAQKCTYFGNVPVFGTRGGVSACTANAACRNGKDTYATPDNKVTICSVGGKGCFGKPLPEPMRK